jgi:ABC-type antimicrobial peptide transport system permease subunit
VYSAINIIGLATGIAVTLLIGLWIWDELSYDRYHTNHRQLAQVMTTQTFNGVMSGTTGFVAIPLSNELRNYTIDFKRVAMTSWNEEHILATGEEKLSKQGMWVQPGFPEMLSLKMLRGERNVLNDPSSILLSASVATALFGNADPINKLLKLDNKAALKVAGVYEDLPHNTSFYDVKFLAPWDKYIADESWLQEARSQWTKHCVQLFVQMNDHADIEKATRKIKDIPMQHINVAKDGKEALQLHPMDKWHLYSEFKKGKVVGGRIQFVWLFGIIGVFVLLLACINFMNLSTARSEKRAREVGIRKAIGSLRQQLMWQFLSESLLVTLLSFVLSLILLLLVLPFFNTLANKEIQLPWSNPFLWLLALGFTIFTGLIAGSYPAFYLSGFRPVKVLKGTFRAGRSTSLFRKVLVVLQFTVSVTLIIGTIIVFRQIQHTKNRPVGYSREGLITVLMNTPDLYGHTDAIRNDLLRTGAVENMGESSSPVTLVWSKDIGFDWKGKDPSTIPLFGVIAVTHDFGKTVGWNITAGRDFSRSFSMDTGTVILNEAAVKITGFKHPVGEIIKWKGQNHQIVGVVKDMVMESPYSPIRPTIFFLQYGWSGFITIRIKPAIPVREALGKIEPVFRKYNPGSPFKYKFTDEEYARKFSDEERIGNLATFFATLAIFISCLGLFGLASFMAEQRTKEIGIRKVMGASVFNLWKMLSKDFVMLVVISCLIAIPIAWYVLACWLQQYEYHTQISWWIFLTAGMAALLITLLTVSYQAIKAALINPVKSLRAE